MVVLLQLLSGITLHSHVYVKFVFLSITLFSFGLDDCDASNVNNLFPKTDTVDGPAIFATNPFNLTLILNYYVFVNFLLYKMKK